MAILNFPNNPGFNETYEENGVVYIWDGEKWRANTQAAFDNNFVNIGGDTMTGGLNLPNLVASGDVQSTSQNGGQLAGFRNQIINGGMAIDQRYDGTLTNVTSTNEFVLDRWRGIGGNEGGSNSMQLGRVDTPVPADDRHLRYAMEISHVNGASFSGTVGCITSIEDGFREQTELTLSIRCTEAPTRAYVYYSNDAFSTGVSQYDGLLTDLSGADDANGYRSYGVTFTTQSNTALGNACFIRFEWSGGTPRYMTGVQLEPGPVATPFEHRPYGTELALCERYFYKFVGELFALTYARTGGSGDYRVVNFTFPTTMRSTPTMNNVTFTGGGSDMQIFANPSGVSVIQTPKSVANGTSLKNFEAEAEL